MSPLMDLATHFRQVLLKRSFSRVTLQTSSQYDMSHLSAQWLCSTLKAGEAAMKRRGNGFGVVIFVGRLAVSCDHSGIVALVIKKEDRIAQKELYNMSLINC